MLLHAALRRVGAVVPASRTLVVVAEEHRRFWQTALSDLPQANVIVQPRNRGTAAGILLPLLDLLRRDPDARVLLMPADHHVEDEAVLESALQAAMRAVLGAERRLLMLCMAAYEADQEYGWIVPGTRMADGLRPVRAFIEKPGAEASRALAEAGALVNSFILAAPGTTLVAMFQATLPSLLQRFAPFLSKAPSARELCDLYDHLLTNDFSKDVLERVAESLRVLAVPPCGWSDLGTPTRLQRFFGRGRAATTPSVSTVGGQV